jgi:hypothetical protein
MGDRRSATPLGGCPGAGGQCATKLSQAALESFGEIGCLEDGQQAPRAVQVRPADPRQVLSGQPDAGRGASAAAYVLDR